MIRQPSIRPSYAVRVVEGQGVLLLSERDPVLLCGRPVERVVPLLDGHRTPEDIVLSLAGEVAAPEVYYVLFRLEQQGYLAEGDTCDVNEGDVFWDLMDVNTHEARQRPAEARISVVAVGAIEPEPMVEAFQALGITVAAESDRSVVLTDDYLNPGLDAFSRSAQETGRPYLLARPVGSVIWIGPVFGTEEGGCWFCLADRLWSNRLVEQYLVAQGEAYGAGPRAGLVSTQRLAVQLVATEVAKWLALDKRSPLVSELVTFDTKTLETQHHTFVRRPQCQRCGTPVGTATPIRLQRRGSAVVVGGGVREVEAEATLVRYGHHISPLTGAVRSLRQLSDPDQALVYSYAAAHYFGPLHDVTQGLSAAFRNQSGGKGRTDAQARASALCEALERYSGVFQGHEERHQTSLARLGQAGIHPNTCLGFSERQYAEREVWNAQYPQPVWTIPEPFDEECEIDWTPLWSLSAGCFKYLPTAYCYYGYEGPGTRFCRADSNGCAAGNSMEEALIQGFLELVERDGVALWWFNRLRRPALYLDSFDDPYVKSLQAHYDRLGRDLWVLDVTSDLGIPVFVALSRREAGTPENIILGFGAHFDPSVALLRALTELNQILPAVSAPDRGGTTYARVNDVAQAWWKTATLDGHPYLVPDPDRPAVERKNFAAPACDDLCDYVQAGIDLAAEKGLEVLVLDQTRPDIGLSVARVVVPGLRHFWRRLGPGRLYDVPVRLGWLPAPQREEEMNPLPMFL